MAMVTLHVCRTSLAAAIMETVRASHKYGTRVMA